MNIYSFVALTRPHSFAVCRATKHYALKQGNAKLCLAKSFDRRMKFGTGMRFSSAPDSEKEEKLLSSPGPGRAQQLGPHRREIIDTVVGSLLGDGWGEKRSNKTRFHFHYSSKNVEYLAYLQNLFYKNGYCSSSERKREKSIGKSGKIYYSIRTRTFSFASFNYLYDAFYIEKKKVVPEKIGELLNARALAIWIMDDGGLSGSGVKISTESFSLQEVERLQKALFENFNLKYTIQRYKEKHILYLSKAQLVSLEKIVKPFMISCMFYKLNTVHSS